MNTNQSDFYAAPVAGNEPSKKKGTLEGPLRIIVPVVLILAAICMITGIVLLIINNSPKVKVMKAFARTFTSVNTPLSDYIGADDLQAMLTKGNYQEDLSLSLDDINLYGFSNKDVLTLAPSISISRKLNHEAKKASVNFKTMLGTTAILNTDIYADDTNIAIACPEYYNNYLTFGTTDIDKQYNSSIISKLSGVTLDSDLDIELFDSNMVDTEYFLSLYKERYPKDLDSLYDAVTVKKTTSDNILIGGQTLDCPGYEISVPPQMLKATITNLVTLYSEVSGLSDSNKQELLLLVNQKVVLPEALLMTVYLDKQSGGIVKVLHIAEYQYQKQPHLVDVTLQRLGTDSSNDGLSALINITDADFTKLVLELNNTFKTIGTTTATDFSLEVSDAAAEESLFYTDFYSAFDSSDGTLQLTSYMEYDNYNYYDLSVDGNLSQIKKGKNFSYKIDNLDFSIFEGDFSFNLSGAFSLKELTEEVAQPQGTAIPLFQMNIEEFDSLLTEIQGNINSSYFGGFVFS